MTTKYKLRSDTQDQTGDLSSGDESTTSNGHIRNDDHNLQQHINNEDTNLTTQDLNDDDNSAQKNKMKTTVHQTEIT